MKATLRKQLRIARRSLNVAEHERRSERAAAAVERMAAFKCGSRIALYLPFDRETDTRTLIAAARRRGLKVYVPVVVDRRHRRLEFHPLSGPIRRGAFGIAVPRHGGKPVAPRWFDIMVVPLVGIDGAGRRLGMGGGFYDRALRFRRERCVWRGPMLVGFAFDCQRIADVHADFWDVRLDCAATESGLQYF